MASFLGEKDGLYLGVQLSELVVRGSDQHGGIDVDIIHFAMPTKPNSSSRLVLTLIASSQQASFRFLPDQQISDTNWGSL